MVSATYLLGEPHEFALGTEVAEQMAAPVGVDADDADVLGFGLGVAADDPPPRGGRDVGNRIRRPFLESQKHKPSLSDTLCRLTIVMEPSTQPWRS